MSAPWSQGPHGGPGRGAAHRAVGAWLEGTSPLWSCPCGWEPRLHAALQLQTLSCRRHGREHNSPGLRVLHEIGGAETESTFERIG